MGGKGSDGGLLRKKKMAAHATADVQTPASSKSGTRAVHRPKRPPQKHKSIFIQESILHISPGDKQKFRKSEVC